MNPNHSAFPATEYYDERPIGVSSGLTKHEYFAAMAMQGLLASNIAGNALDIARCSILHADALIKALSKES